MFPKARKEAKRKVIEHPKQKHFSGARVVFPVPSNEWICFTNNTLQGGAHPITL